MNITVKELKSILQDVPDSHIVTILYDSKRVGPYEDGAKVLYHDVHTFKLKIADESDWSIHGREFNEIVKTN